MKIKTILVGIAMTAAANAATITLSAGFGTGLVPTSNPSYVAVGSFVGFSPIGASTQELVTNFDFFASQTISGKLSGAYTGFDPVFNNQKIFILVGDGSNAVTSLNVAIFETTSNFVADVTAAGGSIINTANTAFIANTFAGSAVGNTITLSPIPEPSAVILGAFGVLGLLRRRRN